MRGQGKRRPDDSRWSGRPDGPGRSDSGQEPARRLDRFGRTADAPRGLLQKLTPPQAGIAQPALRVENSQFRRPARRPEPIPCHANLGSLPYHVSPQPNPRSTAQLQPQCGDLAESTRQGGRKTRRLQDEQLHARSTSHRSQPAKSIRQFRCWNPCSIHRPGLEVQQQQVDGSILEEHRRHGQRLFQRIRRQNDQPVELDAPSHSFDRIQTAGQVQVRHDPAGGLGLSHRLQCERRLATGPIAMEGGGRGERQTAQSKDLIQGAKAGGYRPIRSGRGTIRHARHARYARSVRHARHARHARQILRIVARPRRYCQRPHDLGSPKLGSVWASNAQARSCLTQAVPEGRQSGLDVRGRGRHGTSIIEHMFYQSRVRRGPAFGETAASHALAGSPTGVRPDAGALFPALPCHCRGILLNTSRGSVM
jgi:hypothetical protein